MNAVELLARAESMGVSLRADGGELVLRTRKALPDEFIDELRRNKADLLATLNAGDDPASHPTACRGCARVIPAGTTLCAECGSARSPLVRYAVELSVAIQERTLRGQALVALDKRRYPRLRLPGGQTVGPGLVAWCPVLREADAPTIEAIRRLAEEKAVPAGAEERAQE